MSSHNLAFAFYFMSALCTQMGREVLEGLRVMQKPAEPIMQENQQTDHFPSRYRDDKKGGPLVA